ncbi:sulfatase-like hydrolase/transferase [Pontiella desulfatans]|nr:sulfatase-like hydrolase/transferase [Pontiella desulfatans]
MPNILLIISDDQGYGDFGFTGNDVVQTPAIDRLAAESAFYPYFMVGPACTPTRSSLFTGRNYLDTGVWGVGSRGKVRRDETLIPKFFTPSGYKTWAFGKMDGGLEMMEMTPSDRGFDWFCGITGGYLHQQPELWTPEGRTWTEGWSAELITDAAIEKINEAGDTPWLAVMAHIIPHLWWDSPESYAEPFRKKGYSEDIAQCYGSIKQMDDQIARLLQAVEEAGQAEHTIVLFMSDNGSLDAMNNREMGVWENSEPKRPHSPDWGIRNPGNLIGRKGEVWDNGIRSPLLVRWPGKVKPGIRKQPVGVEDVLPTLLELAQIPEEKHPEHFPFSGTSFSGSLKDRTFSDDRDIFRLATGGPGVPVGEGANTPDMKTLRYSSLHTILRNGNYKFHHLPGGEFRLYDMEKDPAEQNDLSAEYPERTEAMAQRCRLRWDDIAARNRTFQMRQLRINNADRPGASWNINVLQPLRLTGKMDMHDYLGGVKGFRYPGDRADYAVEVQKPLTVSFIAEGTGFDRCAPISLLIDGKPVTAKSRSAEKNVFGPIALPSGTVPFSLAVANDAKAGTAIGEVLKLTLKLEK